MKPGNRILGVTLLIDLLALILLFAWSVYDFSADRVVPVFAARWQLSEALIGLIRWLPGLQFLCLAVALGAAQGKAGELMQGSILPAAILSAILAAFAILLGPPLASQREAILASSASFNERLGAARTALARGDLGEARADIEACQAIDARDPRVVLASTAIEAASLKALRSAADAARGQTSPAPEAGASSARAYYLKAMDFAAKKDFFNAHSWASAAAAMDPSYTDAVRLAARSWEELAARGSDSADKDRAALYSRKLEGYGFLRSSDPVAAYRVFKELSATQGRDPEVQRYLAESLAALDRIAFFKDEADRAFSGTVLGPVFLKLPASGPSLRFLTASSAAWAEGAIYFRELEYLETGGQQETKASMRTALAKLEGGKLLLTSVARDRPAEISRPTWARPPAPGTSAILDLALTPELAYRLVAAMDAPGALSVVDAWRAAREAPSYAVSSEKVVGQLLARAAVPFGVFTAAALGALAGIRFRRRGKGFPFGHFVFVPLMAAVLMPAVIVLERADALISAWAMGMMPGLRALAISAAIRAAILFIAVMLMAGARDEHAAVERF